MTTEGSKELRLGTAVALSANEAREVTGGRSQTPTEPFIDWINLPIPPIGWPEPIPPYL